MGEAKRRKAYALANPTESNWGLDLKQNVNILVKEPPPSLVRMREALQLPFNKDIYDAAIKQPTFETVLGEIAARLNIALDGYYDVPDLCEKLFIALRDRPYNIIMRTHPEDQFPGLKNAAMIEEEDTVKLMEFDQAVDYLQHGEGNEGKEAPYTVCNSCTTSLTCCKERKCCLGTPVTQLGWSKQNLDKLGRLN